MNRLYALLPPSASDATTLRIVDLFLGKKTEGWEKSSCDELKALKIFLLFYCSGTRAHKANKTRDVKKVYYITNQFQSWSFIGIYNITPQ